MPNFARTYSKECLAQLGTTKTPTCFSMSKIRSARNSGVGQTTDSLLSEQNPFGKESQNWTNHQLAFWQAKSAWQGLLELDKPPICFLASKIRLVRNLRVGQTTNLLLGEQNLLGKESQSWTNHQLPSWRAKFGWQGIPKLDKPPTCLLASKMSFARRENI